MWRTKICDRCFCAGIYNPLLALPIFIMDKLWGFISLSNDYERIWTETEFSILKSFAVTLGTAIERIQRSSSW